MMARRVKSRRGRGILKCGICGNPTRDHPIIGPCPEITLLAGERLTVRKPHKGGGFRPKEETMDAKPIQRTMNTCPVCGQLARTNLENRNILAHSVPRDVYKDGRGCRGAGRIAVELRRVR